jgi:transcriptional regulator with XRE-family HTH domain
MWKTPSAKTTASLIARSRLSLGLTQGALAEALSVTRRTVGRWEGRRSAPTFDQLRLLAAMVHPKDAALAGEIAVEGATTLEELGLVAAKASAPPQVPSTPAAPSARPFPPADLMIDSVLHVSARALDLQVAGTDPVSAVRAVLRAAFERARGLGLTLEEIDAVLSTRPAEGATPKATSRASASSGKG